MPTQFSGSVDWLQVRLRVVESRTKDPTGQFAYVVNGSNNVSGFGAVSAFSIGSNGALTPVPGSPFATGDGAISVAITPEVPFAASFANLEIEARHRPGFELKEFFTLGTNSHGINPVTENVTLQIGTFSDALAVLSVLPLGVAQDVPYYTLRIFLT